MEKAPKLWSLKEIAAYLAMHINTVRRYHRAGLLPEPVKAFGSRRWDANEVIEAMKRPRKL